MWKTVNSWTKKVLWHWYQADVIKATSLGDAVESGHKLEFKLFFKLFLNWRHDIQHNDIQHNDIQHNDIQHNGAHSKATLKVMTLNIMTEKNQNKLAGLQFEQHPV